MDDALRKRQPGMSEKKLTGMGRINRLKKRNEVLNQ
jgi:hypothetical protein